MGSYAYSHARGAERALRVLLVDDDADTLEILGLTASRMGLEALYLTDSREVVEVSRSWHPDVIVLDVYMPHLDGPEVLTELRADPATQSIPVVFITAGVDPDSEGLKRRPGVLDFLFKPMLPAELFEQVLAVLLRDEAASLP